MGTTNKRYFDEVKKLAAGRMTGDSLYKFTGNDVDNLINLQWEEVQARIVESGRTFQTPEEAERQLFLKMAGDMLPPQANGKYGYGTLLDPQMYTQTNVPVMFGPAEASAVYANGGLPATIIDKKTRSMVVNGVTFRANEGLEWNEDDIDRLEAAAQETGFIDVVADAICDAFLHGGSVVYPMFDTDTAYSLDKPLDTLKLEKGCITRWVEVDRWNVTIVPNYIITAADYLHPSHLLIPMSNTIVDTSRAAMLKPRSLNYWAALWNLSWCPSDLNGWMRAYYAYEITQMSVPVMAQQMSLLLYRMPLDALNATIGPNKVKELMEINKEQMSEWSALKPEAVNMVGEVEVVNRTYSGFDNFVGATKSELAAQCGIPEPSLWHTPNKGFSDNMTESLLKQSETLQLAKMSVEKCAQVCKDCLIAHAFGKESKQWKARKTLRMVFDKPALSTEKDMAEVGARFAASVNSFVQAGVSPDVAIKLSKPFFASVKVTEEMLASAKKSYEENGQRIGGVNDGAAKQQGINNGKGTNGFKK